MTARPRRTTTLVGPNRLVLAAATAGLVALASAGTALLVLTGTSSVAPVAAPAPPLPTSTPLTRAPGVVVLPSDDAGRLTGDTGQTPRPPRRRVVQPVPVAAPPVLAFTDVPAPVLPAAPPVVAPPAPPVSPPLPALHRPVTAVDVDTPERPGRHLAKGHEKHGKKLKHAKHAKHAKNEKHAKNQKNEKHAKQHGKRGARGHSRHFGNR